jgi:NOL1/NOP2/fmu family ribosome biogenesis protein
MGEWVHSKLNPDHELALAQLLKREGFPLVNLEKEQALSFLRREAFDISDNVVKSWNLIVYEGYSLGWIKNIGNRFNNYYPKEWRIRMQS